MNNITIVINPNPLPPQPTNKAFAHTKHTHKFDKRATNFVENCCFKVRLRLELIYLVLFVSDGLIKLDTFFFLQPPPVPFLRFNSLFSLFFSLQSIICLFFKVFLFEKKKRSRLQINLSTIIF